MEPTKLEQRFSREEFLKNLEESTLVSAEDLARLLADRPAADSMALAQALVEMGLLTVYQMDAISHGRHKELRIGNYDVLEKLGAGGMGTVYKARHRRMKRIVALKVLAKSLLADKEFVRRFQREVETIAQLNHPNIVLAHDADEAEAGHFLVMELVNGQDLASYVQRRGRMTVAEAIDCILQSARGLEYVHGKGMIHRDIKPANLLRDVTGAIKVTDLGLARLSGSAGPASGITQAGGILGTVDFMPPEQAVDSSKLDPRADIYSLGATLYFLLTGQPPYSGQSFMATLLQHRDAPIPSLSAARPDVPAELATLFRRMLAKAPADRPQSMAEVVKVLTELQKSAPGAALGNIEPGPLSGQTGSGTETPAAAGDYAQTMNLQPPSTAHDKRLLKILLVEPSRTQAGIIRRYLQDQEIDQVAVVASGQEALGAAKADPPSAVICTLHLPDMTGIHLAQQIRAEIKIAGIGIVLISTETESADAGTLSKCGKAVLLHKPFSPEKLIEALSTVLGQPLVLKVAGTSVLTAGAANRTLAGPRQALRVLLVDDSAVARLHEKRILQGLGFVQFVEVGDGAQAVAAVARDKFDLIVTDYNMPYMDGKGLVGYLKQNPATASVPILMITTETDSGKLDAVRRLGVTVCDKSFKAEVVRNIVDSWFK